MKKLFIIPTLLFINGCALFSPAPFSDYNASHTESEFLKSNKPYVVDMGKEKILIDPNYYTEGSMRIIYARRKQPKMYRYENGKMIEVEIVNLNK